MPNSWCGLYLLRLLSDAFNPSIFYFKFEMFSIGIDQWWEKADGRTEPDAVLSVCIIPLSGNASEISIPFFSFFFFQFSKSIFSKFILNFDAMMNHPIMSGHMKPCSWLFIRVLSIIFAKFWPFIFMFSALVSKNGIDFELFERVFGCDA